MFLALTDYKGIKANILSGLLADDATREPIAQGYAIKTVIGYCSTRYNIQQMLQVTGPARDETLMEYIQAISLYKIYQSADPKFMPASREKDYNDTREFLKAISDGTMNMTSIWPVVKNEDGQTETGIRAGGNEVANDCGGY